MNKLKQAATDWWDAVLAFVGAVFVVDSILSPAQTYGFIDNDSMRTLGAVLFFVFGTIAILRARVSLNRYKNTLPEIVVSKHPTWELKEFNNRFRYALSVEFKNAANHPSENSMARHVSATVRWKDTKDNLVTENHGRWHVTHRQKGLGHTMQTVDIYPNDQEAKFHFAIKSKDGNNMYAWYRAKDEGDVEYELHEQFYKVEIALTDSRGLKWTFIYLIENELMPEAPEKQYNDDAPVVY
jgi:hypothetical protein